MIGAGTSPTSHLIFHGREQALLINRLNKFYKTGLGCLSTKLVKLILLQGPMVTITGFAVAVLLQYLEDPDWNLSGYFIADIFKFVFLLSNLWDITWLITVGTTCGLCALFLSYTAILVGATNVFRYIVWKIFKKHKMIIIEH